MVDFVMADGRCFFDGRLQISGLQTADLGALCQATYVV
jgi:hypothetical protein